MNNNTADFTDLQLGDLVKLRTDYTSFGGKFAGKIVEVVSAEDYTEYEDNLVVYVGRMRARGGVVFSSLPFTPADVAVKAAGWCSDGGCAEQVFNENEPCDYHRKRASDFNGFLSAVMA